MRSLLCLLVGLVLLCCVAAVKKFDTTRYQRVSLKKPLGLGLEEVAENKARGVMISEVKDGGSAKAAGLTSLRGKFLCSVNDIDVRYKTFDEILDVIGEAPAEKELALAVVNPDDVFKGPAELTVTTREGKEVVVKTVKGLMLRDVLLSSGIDVYTNTAKLTNCGGGLQCGTCVVDVQNDEDWESRADIEAKRLKKYSPSCRLSCNTLIEGDCKVVVCPPKVV
jgi:ferredoxin